MKKTFVSAMLLICLLCSMTILTACSGEKPSETLQQPEQNKPTYESEELTKNNYNEYLFLNLTFDSLDVEYVGTNALGLDSYVLSFVGYVSASRTGNYQFENASVLCGVTFAGWQPNNLVSLKIKLDYDGNGRVSFCVSKESSSNIFNLVSDDFTVTVFGSSGTVRVYE